MRSLGLLRVRTLNDRNLLTACFDFVSMLEVMMGLCSHVLHWESQSAAGVTSCSHTYMEDYNWPCAYLHGAGVHD